MHMGLFSSVPTHRQQVLATWQSLQPYSLPLRVLSESWPPVLPKCEGGLLSAWQNRGHSTQRWLETLSAFDELREYRDKSTLLRRAVELLRDKAGLERAAIFLLDPSGRRLFGTWGTDAEGHTTDERNIAFDAGASHREAFTNAQHGSAFWSRFSGVPLFAESARGTIVVRTGENVIIPIPGRGGSLGLVACDWALTGARADTETLLRATFLTRILSLELDARRDALLRDDVNPVDARGQGEATEIAARATQLLYADPNLDRHLLARRLGVSATKLGRAFKAALGESLRDYRNRLRLERYSSLVEPGGGNLLQAALDAGFGSYAQFHRIFRRRFGCSPIEHARRAGHGDDRRG